MRIRSGLRRTTTQMLNHSRRKAGLSTSRRSSLLSAARNQVPGLKDTRLGMLNANSIQSARLARSNYQKLERSATSLEEQTKLLAERADAGIAGGKSENLTGTAANVVQHFNDTLDGLKQASGILNDYYRQAMKEIATTNKSALAEIGITVKTDGSLSLNKEKLAEADQEKVKKALGAESDFAKRVATVASRAADNATAGAASAASQYNSSGNLANSYLSRYNFRG